MLVLIRRLLLNAFALVFIFPANAGAQTVPLAFEKINEFMGTQPSEQLGSKVACHRQTQILVGAPGADSDDGSVRIYDPISGSVVQTLAPLSMGLGDRFGTDVANLSDLNADGIDDILIGAPGVGSGQGYIYSSSNSFSGAIASIFGSDPNGRLGEVVADYGMLTFNAVPDRAVIIGLPGFMTGDGALGFYTSVGSEIRTITGIAGESLGSSAAVIMDFDGDGFPEVLTGTPQREDGLMNGVGGIALISPEQGTILSRAIGDVPDVNLGVSVALLGDLDGDGVPEVAAGATASDSPGPGYVRVYSGANLNVMPAILCNISAVSDSGASFGHAIADLGDINDDGISEFAIGDPSASAGPSGGPLVSQAGKVFIYTYDRANGNCNFLQSLQNATVPISGTGFGISLASTGCDFDQDGTRDLVIGTFDDTNSTDSGSVTAWRGIPLPTPTPTATPTATPVLPTSSTMSFSISERGRFNLEVQYNQVPSTSCSETLHARVAVGSSLLPVTVVYTDFVSTDVSQRTAAGLPRICRVDGARPIVHMVVETDCGGGTTPFFSNVFSRFMNCGVDNEGARIRDWLDIIRGSFAPSAAAKRKVKRKKQRLRSMFLRNAARVQCRR
ncbi:MAG: FG-GAP repeat protein [Deltaproteobacteria bacterium]|nr:FG-GAP repeat protein [Deltaproteobacteria bacterium]